MKIEKAVNLILNHEFCSIRLKEKLNEFLFNLNVNEDLEYFSKSEEVLLPIEDFENYYASSLGKIYSKKSKRYLKPFISNSGYEVVSLSLKGEVKKYSVHRLICKTFRAKKDGLDIVDHVDGNKLNNHVNNLRWSNNSFNQFNRYKEN